MKTINYKTIAMLSLLVFMFLLGFSFSVQAYRISQQELNSPVNEYLRENYGVNSIEEYRAKLEQEIWLNYSRQMEALASQYPELDFSQWQNPNIYRQYGTSTYQPPKITPQQPFYTVIFSEPITALQIFSLSGLGLIGLATVPPIRKSKRLKQALIIGIVVLCVFSVGYFTGYTVAQTGLIAIEPASLSGDYSYLIETDGTYVWAKSGKTGEVVYGGQWNAGGVSGTNATAVIQQALNALTPNRTWKEKVLVKGNYENLGRITIPSYTIFEVHGRLKAKAGLNKHFIYSYGTSNIEICGGIFDGNSANQTANMDTVYLGGVTESEVHGCYIYGGRRVTTDGEALELEGCTRIDVHDNIFENTPNCYDMIKLTGGSTFCTIGHNLLRSDVVGLGASNAIQLADSNTMFNTVVGNVIRSHDRGIKMHSASLNVVEANVVSAVGGGIECVGSASKNLVKGNIVTSYGTTTPCQLIYIRPVASTDVTADNVVEGNLLKINDVAGGVGIKLSTDIVPPAGSIQRTRIKNNVIFGGTETDTGILIDSIASDTYIEGNDLSDAALNTKISNAGVNTIMRRNRGYVTENSGTATIPTGATSVTVAHGLAATPTKVIVTPRGNIGAVWVSARDATSITISCSTAPTADTIVDWYAEV